MKKKKTTRKCYIYNRTKTPMAWVHPLSKHLSTYTPQAHKWYSNVIGSLSSAEEPASQKQLARKRPSVRATGTMRGNWHYTGQPALYGATGTIRATGTTRDNRHYTWYGATGIIRATGTMRGNRHNAGQPALYGETGTKRGNRHYTGGTR